MVTISPSDYWGGWVGFYPFNSSQVSADEDAELPAILTIERKNASFGDVQV